MSFCCLETRHEPSLEVIYSFATVDLNYRVDNKLCSNSQGRLLFLPVMSTVINQINGLFVDEIEVYHVHPRNATPSENSVRMSYFFLNKRYLRPL